MQRPLRAARVVLGALTLIAFVPCVAAGATRSDGGDSRAADASGERAEWLGGYCRRTAEARAPGMSSGSPVDEYSIANSAADCAAGDRMWFRPRLSGADDREMLERFLEGLPRWLDTLAPGAEPYWRTRFPDADSRYLLPRAKRVQVRQLAATDALVDWYPAADMGSRDGIVRFYAILVVDGDAGRSELRMTTDYDRADGSFRVYVQPEGRLAGH